MFTICDIIIMVINMRLRNVKGAAATIESSDYIILNPKDNKGSFNRLFNNDNPIYIEIGMGKGNFIIENAIKNPNINFIGIEKFDSVMVRAIEKLNGKYISNLKFIKMDATEIDEVFEKEIDRIYLNFSDPWPKKRHAKRRLTHTEFLRKYDRIFKSTREIVLKTDNRKLFEFSIIELTNYGYKIQEISLDLYKDDIIDNIQTEYEKRFNEKGFPIYMISLKG